MVQTIGMPIVEVFNLYNNLINPSIVFSDNL
jgi:hypothetical protein